MRSQLDKAMFDETRNTRLTSARLRDEKKNGACSRCHVKSFLYQFFLTVSVKFPKGAGGGHFHSKVVGMLVVFFRVY